ncbi:hypothetical protein GGI1_00245, partial [Acidithiobacillus sp. GGI-221]
LTPWNCFWQLLRHGEIQNHGFFFQCQSIQQPIPVDKQVWDRYLKQAKKVRQQTASQDPPTKNTSLVAA